MQRQECMQERRPPGWGSRAILACMDGGLAASTAGGGAQRSWRSRFDVLVFLGVKVTFKRQLAIAISDKRFRVQSAIQTPNCNKVCLEETAYQFGCHETNKLQESARSAPAGHYTPEGPWTPWTRTPTYARDYCGNPVSPPRCRALSRAAACALPRWSEGTTRTGRGLRGVGRGREGLRGLHQSVELSPRHYYQLPLQPVVGLLLHPDVQVPLKPAPGAAAEGGGGSCACVRMHAAHAHACTLLSAQRALILPCSSAPPGTWSMHTMACSRGVKRPARGCCRIITGAAHLTAPPTPPPHARTLRSAQRALPPPARLPSQAPTVCMPGSQGAAPLP